MLAGVGGGGERGTACLYGSQYETRLGEATQVYNISGRCNIVCQPCWPRADNPLYMVAKGGNSAVSCLPPLRLWSSLIEGGKLVRVAGR